MAEAETPHYTPSTRSNQIEPDLEKQDTESQSIDHTPLGIIPSRRRTRTQSLTRRNTSRSRFTHLLAHVKTTELEIVDFEGPDDPYHPQNWPFRKKVVTTLLYGYVPLCCCR
jgi:DHA1 family multidrug resistance protein-like MFS transporter